MKAAIVEAAGKLAVREVPEPVFGDYEARCELLYGAVCSGTDTHLVQGHPPFCHWLKAPFILGHESVGEVVAVGGKVRYLKLGDRVTRVGTPPLDGIGIGWGGFAEVGVATDWRAMQEDGVDGWAGMTVQQILPPDIDAATGTMFITWRETLSYTLRLGVRERCNVLIVGSGGNGLAFASNARNLGAATVTLVGTATRAEAAIAAGATMFADYRAPDCWDKVRAAVSGGYDVAIDVLGSQATALAALASLRSGGTIGVYGMDDAGAIRLPAMQSYTCYAGGYDEAEAHDRVLSFYRAGKLNPAIWLDRRQVFSLDNINDAFAALRQKHLIKPLVKLSGLDH